MSTVIEDQPVIDEEIWHEWVQKGKLREQATDRKTKVLTGIAVLLLACGSAFYLLA